MRVPELKNDHVWYMWWSRGHLIACNNSFSLSKNLLFSSKNIFLEARIMKCFATAYPRKFWKWRIFENKSLQNVRISRLSEPRTLIPQKIYPLKVYILTIVRYNEIKLFIETKTLFAVPRCLKCWDSRYQEFFSLDKCDKGLENLFQITSIRVFENPQ